MSRGPHVVSTDLEGRNAEGQSVVKIEASYSIKRLDSDYFEADAVQ